MRNIIFLFLICSIFVVQTSCGKRGIPQRPSEISQVKSTG